MTGLPQRRAVMAMVSEVVGAGARQDKACAAISLSERTLRRQPDTLIDLPKQQYATIGSDVATLKIDDDFSAPKASQFDFVAGTLWHRLST